MKTYYIHDLKEMVGSLSSRNYADIEQVMEDLLREKEISTGDINKLLELNYVRREKLIIMKNTKDAFDNIEATRHYSIAVFNYDALIIEISDKWQLKKSKQSKI